jgi:hypothetical protein
MGFGDMAVNIKIDGNAGKMDLCSFQSLVNLDLTTESGSISQAWCKVQQILLAFTWFL